MISNKILYVKVYVVILNVIDKHWIKVYTNVFIEIIVYDI